MQKRFRAQGRCVWSVCKQLRKKTGMFKCGSTECGSTELLPRGTGRSPLTVSLWCSMCSHSEERQSTQEVLGPGWPADETSLVPQGEMKAKDREDIVWAQCSTLSREQQCFNWTAMCSFSRTADGQHEEWQQRVFLYNTWLRRCLHPAHRARGADSS